MSTTLYPGIAFSPQAVLTDNIGAADTIIPVSDVSAFPDAPNLATIGTDEDGETVLYTAKTTSALSGCQRGVEGAAKSWQAGELIGRNFTAKDHDDLIAAVQEAAKTAEADGVTFDDGETFQQKYDSGELVGPIGKTGPTGKDGPQGPDGKTAYQYAVDGGYTGTEAEFQTLLNDIPNKQSKLTGTAGQVVGFGADGSAKAVPGWSNPNLLINWYFPGPVNQKTKMEYAGKGYTIDCWQDRYVSGDGIKELTSEGIHLKPGFNTNGLIQDFETFKHLSEKTVTFSILVPSVSGTLRAHIAGYNAQDTYQTLQSGDLNAPGILQLITTLPDMSDFLGFFVRIYNANASTDAVVAAAKLELGAQQTLAHQDASGNWVLNDPPPNKALELTKCQRYLIALNQWQKFPIVEFSPNIIDFVVPIPTSMRANPSMVGKENITDLSATVSFNDFEFSAVSNGPALCCRLLKSNHGFTLEQIGAIQIKGLSFLDANL